MIIMHDIHDLVERVHEEIGLRRLAQRALLLIAMNALNRQRVELG